MSRGLPEVDIGNVWSENDVISVFDMRFSPKVLNLPPHGGSFGMPEDETAAGIFLNGKEIQLLSQETMVPLLGLLPQLLVRLELFRILPRRGVDPLEHLPFLVPSPIGPRDVLQRDSLGRQIPRGLHVRTGAQIPPLVPDVIDRDVVGRNGVQNLLFERLVDGGYPRGGLLARHVLAMDRELRLYDLVHRLFDLFQVPVHQLAPGHGVALLVHGVGEVKVVVEAVVDPGSDGHLCLRKHLLHGHRHHVRGRVADAEEGRVVVVRGQLHLGRRGGRGRGGGGGTEGGGGSDAGRGEGTAVSRELRQGALFLADAAAAFEHAHRQVSASGAGSSPQEGGATDGPHGQKYGGRSRDHTLINYKWTNFCSVGASAEAMACDCRVRYW
mmetsp:Transcript_13372/g.29493  ORF Transcript_13372/g.29493 Transcript_13372/m.29493 type:complete len:383 (-) Transcript_13372:181-1329(-)